MIDVKLYDDNLSSPTLIEDLTTKVQHLRFGTKLPGGFNICSFDLMADMPEAWEWLANRLFYRLVVSDAEKTLFEGRLEDPYMTEGTAGVAAYGYYANLTDLPWNGSFNAIASATIKTVLTNYCTQISSDQGHIDTTDVTIASTDSDQDLYPQQLFEKLLAFSDSTAGKWDFSVWEDRVPYLAKRDVSSVDWQVWRRDMRQFKLKYRGGDIYNSCYAVYEAGGALTRTATSNDTDSQTKYGLTRRYAVPNSGAVAAAAAQAKRDGYLAEHKDAWPKLVDVILGMDIYTVKGARFPSYWLRAGEVLRIPDVIPASADLDSVSRNARNTFFVTETYYDVDRGTMSLIFDTESTLLTALLARKVT